MNSSLQGTTPGQLVESIRANASLMQNASGQIRYYSGFIPPFALSMAGRQFSKVEKTYPGGINGLVMDWLAVDHPVYHSLLLNTEGGKEWLETQVREILDEFDVFTR
ncbi:MAG: hypothetical protein PHN98_01730 [Smithellaceae bacterium]|nr:hypothetical protein [Smithellaceae bacterium]